MTGENTGYRNVIRAVRERLPKNLRLRRTLPDDGRLRLDGQLPFLFVYRQPAESPDSDRGTRQLVTTEAAYLVTSADSDCVSEVRKLIETLSGLMRDHFGTYLLLEVWADDRLVQPHSPFQPSFEIYASPSKRLEPAVRALQENLGQISLGHRAAEVRTNLTDQISPPGLPSLLPTSSEKNAGCYRVGIAVAPIYRNEISRNLFPLLLQQLRRQFSQACRNAIFAFGSAGSDTSPLHFQSFGPSSMVKVVRQIDQELNEVAESFDFVLQVTPMNSDQAWLEFSEGNYQERPIFYYRPLPYDPSLLKRRLYQIPLERIEDPTLAFLLAEKQTELDRQLSALRDLNTSAFLQNSLQLYPPVEAPLLELAEAILRSSPLSVKHDEESPAANFLPADAVATAAREEIDYYHQQNPGFHASVELSEQITAGLMVSRDRLLISNQLHLRSERLVPLLQHEVGTHLVTYFNGRQQPFRQLATGMAGYETLQEGLAVFSEYLADGLSRARLRSLAARVVAVWSLLQGDDFLRTFELLHDQHNLSARAAYTTSLRVHRGGGLTKDAVYLRGLNDLLSYLAAGHEIEPLYIGKIALEHVLYMQELRRREILRPPAVLPRFTDDPAARQKVEACRHLSILELLESAT